MRFAGEFLTQGGPDFGGMSNSNVELRGKEKNAVHAAESQVNQYGLKSIADIRAAEAQAEATIAQGQAEGQAAMFGGLMDGISGIAGAGIQKFGGSMFGAPKAVDRRSPGMGIAGSVGTNGKPMYGPAW